MADAKITAPNPAAFNSDPLQQIFARGMLDRDMSGLSYMLKSGADMQNQRGQEAYSQGVREANVMSAALARQQMAQEQAIAIMKASAGLMEKGMAPNGMQAAGMIFNDPKASSNDDFSRAILAKLVAEANQANSAAANAGGDKYSTETQVTPNGTAYTTYKAAGKNGAAVQAENEARVARDLIRRGFVVDPNKPMALQGRKVDPPMVPQRYPGVQ